MCYVLLIISSPLCCYGVSPAARLKSPELNVSSTWNASSNSCEVSLTCNLTSEDLANYTWTVRSKTSVGSLLRYNLEPEEEEILFNCTAVSVQSGMSASSVKIVKCNGSAADNLKSGKCENQFNCLLAAVVAKLLQYLSFNLFQTPCSLVFYT